MALSVFSELRKGILVAGLQPFFALRTLFFYLLLGSQPMILGMKQYSAETRVELTWAGWLAAAQGHYETALETGNSHQRISSRTEARLAISQAISLCPNVRRTGKLVLKKGIPTGL